MRVRYVPRPAVDVRFEVADGVPDSVRVRFELVVNGAVNWHTTASLSDGAVRMIGSAGDAVLLWSGSGIARGRAELTLSGESAQVTARIEPGSSAQRDERPWTELVAIGPSGQALAHELVVSFLDRRPGSGPPRAQIRGNGGTLRAKPGDAFEDVHVACGPFLGRFQRLALGGRHELRLEPGGFAQVVVERASPLGGLALRTPHDELVWFGAEGRRETASWLPISQALLVGPLSPGRHTFVLHQGSVALGRCR